MYTGAFNGFYTSQVALTQRGLPGCQPYRSYSQARQVSKLATRVLQTLAGMRSRPTNLRSNQNSRQMIHKRYLLIWIPESTTNLEQKCVPEKKRQKINISRNKSIPLSSIFRFLFTSSISSNFMALRGWPIVELAERPMNAWVLCTGSRSKLTVFSCPSLPVNQGSTPI